MTLFRYGSDDSPLYVELSWGHSYRKQPVRIRLTQKDTDGHFELVQDLGVIQHDPATASKGYTLTSSHTGPIEVKWVRKFLIIEKVQVTVDGHEWPGSEVLNVRLVGMGSIGSHGKHT